MRKAVFAIPGDIATATGGYGYNRRVMALLPAFDVESKHLALPGGFPDPKPGEVAEAERLLATIPEGTTLLIDGLAYCALPADVIDRIDRRIVAIAHHPLCMEAGLSEERQKHLRTTEREALARAARIIVPSRTTRAILIEEFDVPDDKITVAEPGTDPAVRATGTGTPMQILAVGAVSPRKGYRFLVKALEPLKSLDWRLTIAGAIDRHPEAVEELTAVIAATGLSDRVTLAGTVVPATLERHFNMADIFVMPSLFEGYGMVLAEAMARGLPIVCTTGGASSETVPDAAAIKVPPGDAPALTQALSSALRDRKLRVKLADASWEAGRRLPTWNETARRIAAVIHDIKV